MSHGDRSVPRGAQAAAAPAGGCPPTLDVRVRNAPCRTV